MNLSGARKKRYSNVCPNCRFLDASGAGESTPTVHIPRAGLLESQDSLMLGRHGTRSIKRRLMPSPVDLLDAFETNASRLKFVRTLNKPSADADASRGKTLLTRYGMSHIRKEH